MSVENFDHISEANKVCKGKTGIVDVSKIHLPKLITVSITAAGYCFVIIFLAISIYSTPDDISNLSLSVTLILTFLYLL